jgi:hypothetical protein
MPKTAAKRASTVAISSIGMKSENVPIKKSSLIDLEARWGDKAQAGASRAA